MAEESNKGSRDAMAVLGILGLGGSGSGENAYGLELLARGITRGGLSGGGIEAQMTGDRMRTYMDDPGASMPLGPDDAAPLVLGTAGEALGRRLPFLGGGLVGGAIGAGTGRAINPLLYSILGAGPAPSPTGDRLKDVFLEMGGQTAGNILGRSMTATGRAAADPLVPRPSPQAGLLREQFEAVGVDPKASDFAPNLAPLDRSILQTPTGGNVMRQAENKQALQLTNARDEFLGRIAPDAAANRTATGQRASAAILRGVEQTGAIEDRMWNGLRGAATDLPVDLRGALGLKEMADGILLDERRGLRPNPALVAIAQKIQESSDVVPWQVADRWRRELGRDVKTGQLISGYPSGEASALHAALMRNMEAAADAATHVPGLADSYKNVRRFSAQRRAIYRDGEVAQILETDPEQVVKTLGIAGGPSAVKRARAAILGSPELGRAAPEHADLEAWNYVQRHIMEGVFRQATDENYRSLANPLIVGTRLQKAVSSLGRDTLDELLGPVQMKALDNIIDVAKATRAAERIGAVPSTSITPQVQGFRSLITGGGGAAGAALGGFVGGAAGAIGGAALASPIAFLLVPHILAKALTSPRIANTLASDGFRNLLGKTDLTAQGIAKANEFLARLAGEMGAEMLATPREGR